jgi:hypothetical protein
MIVPIESDDGPEWQDYGPIYLNGVWTADYGPWKKGDKFVSLLIDFEDCYIVEMDTEGGLVKQVKFKAVPDEKSTIP